MLYENGEGLVHILNGFWLIADVALHSRPILDAPFANYI